MFADSGVKLPSWVGTVTPEQVAEGVVSGIEQRPRGGRRGAAQPARRHAGRVARAGDGGAPAAPARLGPDRPRDIAKGQRDKALMLFRQITHDDLGCASYLIGDEDAGVAAVVDPKLEIDEYLSLARYMAVSIEHILETHNHADHVSGHGRLAAATGAMIHIHREAEPEYDHEPFDDGWELELGDGAVRALHTPGHRPEHTAFALTDTRARRASRGRCSPATRLFVGDIARPDLAVDKEEGARGDLPLAARAAAAAARQRRGLARAPRRLALRRAGDGHEGLLDDRLRARPQRAAREDDEDRFVSARPPRCGPQPPNFQAVVDINRGPLARRASRRTRSRRARWSRRSATARWWSTCAPRSSSTRRTSRTRCRSRRCRPDSARSCPGSPSAGQEVVLIGRDDEDGSTPRCSRRRSASPGSAATWPAA